MVRKMVDGEIVQLREVKSGLPFTVYSREECSDTCESPVELQEEKTEKSDVALGTMMSFGGD